MSNKNFDPASEIQDILVFGEFGGVNPSITDSATYTFLHAKTMSETFEGKTEGCYLYSRHWNPSAKNLSNALAKMEGTEAAWVTGSGMAAITCTLLQLCNSGDHIIAAMTIYGGTFAFLKNYLPKFNIDVTFVDTTNEEKVKAAIKPNTKVIYTETLNNPLLQVADIKKLALIADKNNIKLVVDNTFTPMIISPKKLGAHIVVYSMTKFINGTNDCVAGAICASEEFINALISVNDGTAMLLGPVLDPLRASSILKNMHTLHIRMQQHSKNAMYLAENLEKEKVDVKYPGLKSHKDNGLMTKMMDKSMGYGGMIAINLVTQAKAQQFMELMQDEKVGYLAVSLGFYKTLFSCPGSSTSSEVPEELQKEMGMSEGMVRFSVGLDHDIERTFKRIMLCYKKVMK
ncbi:MAG: cystathionine beta-lyase [Bacteroidetes bacterium GWE2_29_8]|nr:MAG: cystathionine beta-lyase [Bacteroidetes bacterium GWE2_29_8]OFY21057.1 MAG: cystathionine beta-lyase [Bacteroidetes bacterium GWF2_29_10]